VAKHQQGIGVESGLEGVGQGLAVGFADELAPSVDLAPTGDKAAMAKQSDKANQTILICALRLFCFLGDINALIPPRVSCHGEGANWTGVRGSADK
jgi:hypothetical protein